MPRRVCESRLRSEIQTGRAREVVSMMEHAHSGRIYISKSKRTFVSKVAREVAR